MNNLQETIYNSPPEKSADQIHEEYVQEVTKQIVEDAQK